MIVAGESLEQRMLEDLCRQFRTGNKPKLLFFWGHRDSVRRKISTNCFSQWYEAQFEVSGQIYTSAEHYMMAEKAKLFGDMEAHERILHTPHPGAAKAIGREVRGFVEAVWERHRFEIVCNGNRAKFAQNEEPRMILMATGSKVLVEAIPVDSIWGIGLSADDPEAKDPNSWRGLNLLGFALMKIRAELLS